MNLRKIELSISIVLALLFLLSGCAQQQGAPAMPKRIVDLSPTISEVLPVRTVGSKFLADFGYPERTTFEHKITEEPFYADSFLTAEQKRDIFYNNAARFLRLDKKEQ